MKLYSTEEFMDTPRGKFRRNFDTLTNEIRWFRKVDDGGEVQWAIVYDAYLAANLETVYKNTFDKLPSALQKYLQEIVQASQNMMTTMDISWKDQLDLWLSAIDECYAESSYGKHVLALKPQREKK